MNQWSRRHDPAPEWPVVRRVALALAACQLAGLLTVGVVVWQAQGDAPALTVTTAPASLVR